MTLSPTLIAELLALGITGGFLAGLLGIGGGMLMVPFLTFIVAARGVEPALAVKMAVATSMATIMFTSISSLRAHHGHGAVRWDLVRGLAPGLVLGGLLAGQTAAGTGIGLLSGLVGAGGAFVSVPFMVWCNVPLRQAVGTSAALGFPIALASTTGYIVAGWSMPSATPGAFGYLYLPALAIIATASVMLAPLGARTAHRIDVKSLRRAFAGLLLALAATMLWKVFA